MDVSQPANHAFAIVPSDTAGLSFPAHAIYVGTGGNITLRSRSSPSDVVLKNVPAGAILPIQCNFVRATGTTAADLVALRNTP